MLPTNRARSNHGNLYSNMKFTASLGAVLAGVDLKTYYGHTYCCFYAQRTNEY